MDPITIGSLALGAGNMISGILGQNKQAKLAKQQLAQQKALQDQQLAMAQEDQRLARAGTTDELGNQLAYDPITNTWSTNLSATGKQISDANVGEQLRELQYDAPLARSESIANAHDRSAERQTAGTLRQQLNDNISGRTGVNPNSIASAIRLGRAGASAAGQRQATRAFNTNAIRTGMGAGAAGDALADAGKVFADQAAMSMGNPELEGRQQADEMNQQSRGSLVDAYSAMASRAAGGGNISYTPSSQSSSLAATLANAKQTAASGSANATNAVGQVTRNAQGNAALAAATVPNYSQAFSQAGTMLDGFGGDIMSTLANKYKSRSSNTVPYSDSMVNLSKYGA